MALQAERLLDKFEDMERAVERDLRRAQRRLKQSIPSYLRESRPLNLLAAPNAIEKLNCVYCGYANGVFAYAREIAARTETYWCPIQHASRARDAHPSYGDFAPYGDARAYKRRLPALRRALKK